MSDSPLGRRPLIALTYASDELPEFIHWRMMFEGIVRAGAVPLAVDCTALVDGIAQLVEQADGLIVSGGVDVDPALYGGNRNDPLLGQTNAARDENEAVAWNAAQRAGIPVLAVCRGAQLVNALLGGRLLMDIPRDHAAALDHASGEEALNRATHQVRVANGSMLAELVGRAGAIEVNSEHHQAIAQLAPGLQVSAVAPDGVVEGYEDPTRRLIAVQWHPEVLWESEEHAAALLRNFGVWCARTREARSTASTGTV